MIYEYAIDPAFLLELADQQQVSAQLYRALTVGSPCITSGYPENLGDKARALAKTLSEADRDSRNQARWQNRISKMTELAAQITRVTTKRHNAAPWGQNFAQEHGRFPFEGILSKQPPVGNEPHRNLDWLRTPDCHLYACPASHLVRRNAQTVNKIIEPLLQNASDITFVDPYFFPSIRFESPYKLNFSSIVTSSHVRVQDTREITIICACNTGRNTCIHSEFKQVCEDLLPSWMPRKLTLKIFRLNRIDNGQELHNRYILSDIGGVSFGHGTDDSPNHSYDDISLLSAKQLTHWKTAYTPGSAHFDWSEPPVIITRQ